MPIPATHDCAAPGRQQTRARPGSRPSGCSRLPSASRQPTRSFNHATSGNPIMVATVVPDATMPTARPCRFGSRTTSLAAVKQFAISAPAAIPMITRATTITAKLGASADSTTPTAQQTQLRPQPGPPRKPVHPRRRNQRRNRAHDPLDGRKLPDRALRHPERLRDRGQQRAQRNRETDIGKRRQRHQPDDQLGAPRRERFRGRSDRLSAQTGPNPSHALLRLLTYVQNK